MRQLVGGVGDEVVSVRECAEAVVIGEIGRLLSRDIAESVLPAEATDRRGEVQFVL